MGLNTCCFCIPLRPGTLAVSITYLVVNICAILGWCLTWALVAVLTTDSERHYYPERIHDQNLIFLYILLGVGFVGLVSIAANSLLIHGVRRHQRKFLLPWLIWYGVFQALTTLAWIGTTIWLFYLVGQGPPPGGDGYAAYIGFSCISLVPGLILFSVVWFWYASVVFYYQQLAPSDHYVMEPLRAPDAGNIVSGMP